MPRSASSIAIGAAGQADQCAVVSGRRTGRQAPSPLLGDIVIAYETIAREAAEEFKPFPHHLAHLAVHGFLHLLGYDHETDAEADAMEQLERDILAASRSPTPTALRRGRRLTAMPDTDSASSSHPDGAPYEPRNLPVPVPPAARRRRKLAGARLARAVRLEAELARRSRDVLDAMQPGESGFSPEESRCSRNILGLRERRVDDVMVPRADIVAVQQDITLGELVQRLRERRRIRASWSMTTRSTIRSAWCTSAI